MSGEDGGKKKNYDVGYAKPPKANQFKPGQSGNPRGRPKGSRNKGPLLQLEPLKRIIAKVAYSDVPVRDGDGVVTVPMSEAVMRSIAVKAAKGDHRSQRLFAELVGNVEAQTRKDHEEAVQAAYDYKKRAKEELELREREGVTDAPDILPHPDHVNIDLGTMTVQFNGPQTPQQKTFYDIFFKKYCDAFRAQLDVQFLLDSDEDLENRDDCVAFVEHQKKLQKMFTDEVGKGIGSEGMKRRFLVDTGEFRVEAILKDAKMRA